MFCTKCGSQIPEGNRFCNVCGKPVPGAAPAPTPKPTPAPAPAPKPPKKSGGGRKAALIVVVVLLVIALLAAVALAGYLIWDSLNEGAEEASREEEASESPAVEETAAASEAVASEAPEVALAQLRLVGSDVKDYPAVRVYISVTGDYDRPIYDLSAADFAIRERISGGQYADRPVTAAEFDYDEQAYAVEYISDATFERTAARELQVELEGESCRGSANPAFTPTDTHRYELIVADMSWTDANDYCQAQGGHLATVTTAEEESEIIALAEAQGVSYVWLGGQTSVDGSGVVSARWVTGEDFKSNYQNWMAGEPSGVDMGENGNNVPESYLMLWNVKDGWNWNDQRNDPWTVAKSMSGKMAFVCEFE